MITTEYVGVDLCAPKRQFPGSVAIQLSGKVLLEIVRERPFSPNLLPRLPLHRSLPVLLSVLLRNAITPPGMRKSARALTDMAPSRSGAAAKIYSFQTPLPPSQDFPGCTPLRH